MRRTMTTEPVAVPVEVGDVVGWRCVMSEPVQPATVMHIDTRRYRARLRVPQNPKSFWASFGELTDPPPQATGGES